MLLLEYEKRAPYYKKKLLFTEWSYVQNNRNMTQGISYEGKTLVSVVDKTVIEVPNFVEIIFGTSEKQYAFMESSSITKVTFKEGSNLTTIQKYAFYNCKSLEGICLSSCKNLKSIGDYAFAGCSALKYVDFPESLTTLSEYCFFKTTNLGNISVQHLLAP